jgi:hypothetical protein
LKTVIGFRPLRIAVAAFLLAIGTAAFSHPGVGIVIDSRGNVFYTDLHHVWRIAPDGGKSIAVANVHTHELCLDAKDNLYGEHLWYNGERLDTWGSRVWRRSPDGRIVDIVPSHAGFNDDYYSFVQDAARNMYWAARDKNEIRKRTPDGRVVTMARGQFRDIRWMAATPTGAVYFIDSLDLVEVNPNGAMRVVARNLSRPSILRSISLDRHKVMGLWTDGAGNIYVTDTAAQMVKRVTPAGQISIVARSPLGWSPTGGTFDRSGNLWLLEYSSTNAVRARKIGNPKSKIQNLKSWADEGHLLSWHIGWVLGQLIDDRGVSRHPAGPIGDRYRDAAVVHRPRTKAAERDLTELICGERDVRADGELRVGKDQGNMGGGSAA